MIFLETDNTEDMEVEYFITVESTSASWARLAHPINALEGLQLLFWCVVGGCRFWVAFPGAN